MKVLHVLPLMACRWRVSSTLLAVVLVVGVTAPTAARGQEARIRETFPSSLHATGAGMQLWYSAAEGGLERITRIPYAQLGCSGCHAKGCDACHSTTKGDSLTERNPAPAQVSGERSRPDQAVCLGCHFTVNREVRYVAEHPESGDVHFSAGMTRMDCHTSEEMHGTGESYPSFQAEGALEVRCERCHSDLSATPGHQAHAGTVACAACHVRTITTCYNCHFQDSGSGPSIPMEGLLFLLNRRDQVTVANFHAFVYDDRTLITFAPFFPHTVMSRGRGCPECHGTEAARAVQAGAYAPVVMGSDGPVPRAGVIPVSGTVRWALPFFSREADEWTVMDSHQPPLVHYAGFGSPLTPEQLRKLAGEVPGR